MITKQFLVDIEFRNKEHALDDCYPFTIPAIRKMGVVKLHPHVTFFVGENGSGKSTMLEALAVSCGFNPEGGSRNFAFQNRSSHSELHQHLRISKGFKKPKNGFFFRAESFFNLATEIERLDEGPGGPPIRDSYGPRPLHEQSHGESFFSLLMNRFSGHGLYILDEPEAALSPQRQLSALSRIHELVKTESQFIIATHSPILMAYPDSYIYQFSPEGIHLVKYEETENYKVMHDFIVHPKRMLDVLFEI